VIAAVVFCPNWVLSRLSTLNLSTTPHCSQWCANGEKATKCWNWFLIGWSRALLWQPHRCHVWDNVDDVHMYIVWTTTSPNCLGCQWWKSLWIKNFLLNCFFCVQCTEAPLITSSWTYHVPTGSAGLSLSLRSSTIWPCSRVWPCDWYRPSETTDQLRRQRWLSNRRCAAPLATAPFLHALGTVYHHL